MRTLLALLLALACSVAFGQASTERTDAIWIVASNRMLSQQDVWFEEGDFPVCIAILKFEGEKWTGDYDIWTNLGWMQENIQDYPAAQKTYERYLALNPNDPDRALPEATFFYMTKKYDRVPPLLSGLISKKCHPNNYRVLAWSYEKQKKYAEALKVWKTYAQYYPSDPVIKRNIDRDEKRAAVPSTR